MITDDFVFFWGGTFSQWCPSTFIIDGVKYNSCEQYMMAKKALMFNDFDALQKIMLSKDPSKQKDIGKTVRGFNKDVWETYCREIVFDGNMAKFTQNPSMLKELLETGDREIVEASPKDKIWGIGLHETDPRVFDKSKWLGTNWLGIAIMQVRNKIKG